MKNKILGAALALVAMTSFANAETAGYYVGAKGLTAWQAENDRARQYGFNLNGGYDFGNVRVEGSFDRLANSQNSGGRLGDVKADVLSSVVYFEKDFGNFTPSVGMGLGYAWLSGTGQTNTKDGLVYVGGVGLAYKVNTNLSLTSDYRYMATFDDGEVRTSAGRDQWKAHVVGLGLKYSF